jgi:phage shock protein PspC (stress-responsive transcriptional regulator)
MNKTIIININGFIFHIEEDAYEILKNYMTDVKRHFLNSADSLEITTDIENRIAEMFTEILAAQNKQVIIDQDVNAVIEQMGSVADFESSDDEPKSSIHDSFSYNINKRKLFRDPEDHLIGGVCSGLANYFDAQAIWIRLAFAIAFAFFGTGLILYIILWIVVPKAITRADRMAMKGEKLNLQGFKNNLEEELSTVRGHVADLHNEAKPLIYKVRDFSGDFFDHFGSFLNTTGRLLLKLVGVAIIMACLGFIVFLVVGLFVFVVLEKDFLRTNDIPYNLLRHSHSANSVFVSAFLVGFIPALSIILITLKGVFNTRSINRSATSILLVIWLISIGVLTYYCTKIAANFASSANYSETVSLTPTPNNVYYLKLNELKYLSAEDSVRLNIKSMPSNMQVTDDPYEYNDFEHSQYRVHINIERSDIGQPVMVKSYRARGHNYDEALFNARNITYGFAQQDTVLKFDYRVYTKNDELWHDEELYITLKLPLNAKVIVDRKVDNLINNLDNYNCRHENKQEDANFSTFVITDNGAQCVIDPAIVLSKKNAQRMLDSLKSKDRNSLTRKGYDQIDSLERELR